MIIFGPEMCSCNIINPCFPSFQEEDQIPS